MYFCCRSSIVSWSINNSICKRLSKCFHFLFRFSDLWDPKCTLSYVWGRPTALTAAAAYRSWSQVLLRSCSVTWTREAICVQVFWAGLANGIWSYLTILGSQIPLRIWLYQWAHSPEQCTYAQYISENSKPLKSFHKFALSSTLGPKRVQMSC